MNSMSGSSWRFKRFDRICITVYNDDLRGIGKRKYFDVIKFIEKYCKVDGSDDEMEDDAGGDEVNEFDSEFVNDEKKSSGSRTNKLLFDECHQRFERSRYQRINGTGI